MATLRRPHTPRLYAEDLMLSHPFHRTSFSNEDADGELGRNFWADAICAAQGQISTCLRGVSTCRNVKTPVKSSCPTVSHMTH